MGEIHELFVLAFSLVWFAGATPDKRVIFDILKETFRGYFKITSKIKEPREA